MEIIVEAKGIFDDKVYSFPRINIFCGYGC